MGTRGLAAGLLLLAILLGIAALVVDALGREEARGVASDDAERGESLAPTPSPESAPRDPAPPHLAGRPRPTILPTNRPRTPQFPRRQPDRDGDGNLARRESLGEAPTPPPLAPLDPAANGRVAVRLRAPGDAPLPKTAEVARGVLATGLEWEGTVWIRDGVLIVEDVPEGDQQLVVVVEGWAPVVLSARAHRGRETDLGEAVLDVGKRLEGRVTSAAGKPIRGAYVRGAGRRAETWTDDEGRFELERLPAGPVDVEAEADGFLSQEVEVDVRTEREIRITLEACARVEGHLETSEGKPAPFVRLVLVDVGEAGRESLEPFAFRTDEDGSFEIDAVPGRYRFTTGHDTKEHDAEPVVLGVEQLESGKSTKVALRLPAR